MNIILEGVVGSTAYGLSHEGSDRDILGTFVASTDDVLGLDGSSKIGQSVVRHEPDSTHHELGKYLSLALKCNPTVMELLWLPEYTIETDIGTALMLHREYFLSESYVRNSYGGYARQQAERLMRRHVEGKNGFSSDVKNRTAKHARHCVRLLVQGGALLRDGHLHIDVGNIRDELFEVGDLAVSDPGKFYEMFEDMIDEFNNLESTLPERPDRDKIDLFLRRVRWAS